MTTVSNLPEQRQDELKNLYLPGLVIGDGEIRTKEQIADGVDERLSQRPRLSIVIVVVVVGHRLRSRGAVPIPRHGGPKESTPFRVLEDVRQDARQNSNAV